MKTRMRVLFIGGSQFTGPLAIRELISAGHEVTLLHRTHGDSPMLQGARQILANKSDLPKLRSQLASLHPDVAVHMVAYTPADTAAFIETFAGIASRGIVISSIDVYRAFGRIHRTEPGDPDPIPLAEDAPLRTKLSVQGESYDKLGVERISQSNPKFPCTILRYPAVYGPGDWSHRLHPFVRRMDDNRPFILVGQSQADWQWTHGFVRNVSHALFLAITNPAAAGRIYNVGEPDPLPWSQWIERIGKVAVWTGRVKIIPDDRLPKHLAENLDFRQDWVVDTSRIRRELGFTEIVASQECLKQTMAWERGHDVPADPKDFDYAAEDAVAKQI
jgi:nucleoside-diphosphate-sugar epimerase